MCDPDTSVEPISEHLGISRVQLYKKLISLKGITPSEYLRSMRIRYAEELMRQGDPNVARLPIRWDSTIRAISPSTSRMPMA